MMNFDHTLRDAYLPIPFDERRVCSWLNKAAILGGASGAGYSINYSAQFDGSTGYLSRTPGSAGNSRTFTIRMMGFKAVTGSQEVPFSTRITDNDRDDIIFTSSDTLQFFSEISSTTICDLQTNAVFRDLTGYFDLVVAVDTTQATASNRVKIYLNGDEITSFSTATYPALNDQFVVNRTQPHNIGRFLFSTPSSYWSGYLTEFILVDGQALTPSDFGKTDPITGNWVAKAYTGTYGTNGFYLDFSNAANLGEDQSGNGNDFTVNGTITQVTNTPTNVFWSFNAVHEDRNGTLSNGNRTVSGTVHQVGTLAVDSGKYAWKVTDAGSGGDYGVELANGAQTETTYTASASDVLEFELDTDAGTLDVRVNGGGAASVATGLSGLYVPLCKAPCTITPDFTPADSSFKTLSTNNLPRVNDSVDNHFVTVLDTGANIKSTAESQFTNYMAWAKDRDNVNNHQVWDTLRGTSAILQTNTTAAETTYSAPSGNSVAWVFNLPSNETNTDGDISVDWKYNATLGMAAGTYTGTGTAGHTLGLPTINGEAPKMVIIKSTSATGAWYVYHSALGATKYLTLNIINAAGTSSGPFNDTEPTASLFTLGSGSSTNASGVTFVIYCFWETDFIKIGSYTGNGSADGPFINEMISPVWWLNKRTDVDNNWNIYDKARSSYNPIDKILQPDNNNSEVSGSTYAQDAEAVGWKVRNPNAFCNANTGTYIYMMIGQPMTPTENTGR